MQQLDARVRSQQLPGQVVGGAGPCRGVAQLAGLALARAISSLTLPTASDGCATSTKGMEAIGDTAVKSFSGS